MNYTLENFIGFCDEMMIANESYQDMFNLMQNVNKLSTSFKNDCDKIDDINTIIKKYDIYIDRLIDARDTLSEMNYSFNDKVKQSIAVIASALTIAGSFWLSVKATKVNGILGLFTAIITGQIATIPTVIAAISLNTKDGYMNGINGILRGAKEQRMILKTLKADGAKTKKDTLSYTIEYTDNNTITIYNKDGNIINHEMSVATEGSIHNINKTFKALKNEVATLQKKIVDADGNPEEQIKYYREYKELLSKAEDTVNSIPQGFLENPYAAFITSLVPVFASLVVSVAWSKKNGNLNKPVESIADLKELCPLLAGGASAIAIAAKSGTRKMCLDYIKESRKVTNMIIAYLESGNSKKIKGDFKSDKEYQSNMYKMARTEISKIANSLLNKVLPELKSNIVKLSNANGMNIDMWSDDNCICLSLSDGQPQDTSNYKKLTNIAHKAVNQINTKYKNELKKTGVMLELEKHSDGDVIIYYYTEVFE